MSDLLPTKPFPYTSIAQLLMYHARYSPDKEALVVVDPDDDHPRPITYRELSRFVSRLQTYLHQKGIRRGDTFAILMHNAAEVLFFELAAATIGAATVPLDVKRDTTDRKIFKLQDTKAKALFVKREDQALDEELRAIRRQCRKVGVISWSTLEEFDRLLPGEDRHGDITSYSSLGDGYVILYTSGTTALPKGVLLSQRACLLNAMGMIDWQRFDHKDRFNVVLPLHHINSTEFCLSMLIVGGTIILNSRYSASKFWHIVHTYRATNTSIVPTILHDLLVRSDEFFRQRLDISSLKRICIGSAPVLPEETLRFYDTFGVRVTQGYGQTETALRVAGVPTDVNETTYRKLVKTNTIGTELANNHLAIMDQNNHEKQEGEEGEICIAGPILAKRYLNNPEETSKSFKDGWFHSGDLGYWKWQSSVIASEAWRSHNIKLFFIIGRIKEIIIKGGVNLSPSAIEDALLKAFPEIDEVSVVGYPDERMGEEIAAAVVLTGLNPVKKQGSTLAKRILDAEQNNTISGLSRYEAPKKVLIFDSLPKTSTGKIQRVEVKKIVAELIKKEHLKHYYVRRIAADEVDVIKKSLEINNARFPFVPSTLKEFTARAQNGLFFGAFEEHEGLVGSLSCVRLKHPVVEILKTWNEATAVGTLANYDPKGDTLLCVAISVALTRSNLVKKQGSTLQNKEKKLRLLAKHHIEKYVQSGKDHVLAFHRKSKGGIPGATVWKILPNGRPEDKEAMGYNVLMKYPTIDGSTKIVRSNAPSPAILLIEHALLYAKEKGIKEVIAFSRPAGYRQYLLSVS